MANSVNWWEFTKKDNESWIRPTNEDSVKEEAGKNLMDSKKSEINTAVTRWKQIKDYQFRIRRVKHIVTGEEVMHIIAYNQKDVYGYIISKLLEMDTRIKSFENYGIIMEQIFWDKLCKTVRANYNEIEVERKEFIDVPVIESQVKIFVRYYADYVEEHGIEAIEFEKEMFYDIPVEDFKKAYEESSLDYYCLSDWRKALKMQRYTKCNSNRTDYTAKIKGEENKEKTKKVIRFYADKLDSLREDN